jgi:chemotaxis protein CheD
MDQIVVGMAECRVANVSGQALVTFALGSCIALAVYDPLAAAGGLLHFMLPDSSIDPERGRQNPCMFADTAIPALLDAVGTLGGARQRMIAHAAGGAHMMGDERLFDIGRRNYDALRREMSTAGVTLRGVAVGGTISRNLRLEIGTGKIRLWEGGTLGYAGEPKNPGSDRRRFGDRP